MLHLNCSAHSQSEWSIFFMCIKNFFSLKWIHLPFKLILPKKFWIWLNPRFSTARLSRARGVARPRFRESGSSKAMTSTQEPNRPALSHFPLISRDVVLAFVYFSSKASKFSPEDQDVIRLGFRDEFWFRWLQYKLRTWSRNRERTAARCSPRRGQFFKRRRQLICWRAACRWSGTASYEQELKANEELEIKFNGRLDGSVAVSEW